MKSYSVALSKEIMASAVVQETGKDNELLIRIAGTAYDTNGQVFERGNALIFTKDEARRFAERILELTGGRVE